MLVHAYREDAPRYRIVRPWLEETLEGDELVGVSDVVWSGFLRVVTHPRVFDPPTPIADALKYVEALREHPGVVTVAPGNRHWRIFSRLCREAEVRGNLIPDAFLAALAIEAGSLWVTTDRDFSRFAGLRWATPGRSGE